MIIRSGLIRRKDGTDPEGFTEHWRRVHGPLALAVSGMRAYSQNHIRLRSTLARRQGLHRIDGVSQLYFDDVESMRVAMASSEQRACIEDLRGFLSDVTLLIQREGTMRRVGTPDGALAKTMLLLGGAPAAFEGFTDVAASLVSRSGNGGAVRCNPVVDRSFNVDPSLSAGGQVIDAVVEVWSAGHGDVLADLVEAATGLPGLVVHDAFAVVELVMSTYEGQPHP